MDAQSVSIIVLNFEFYIHIYYTSHSSILSVLLYDVSWTTARRRAAVYNQNAALLQYIASLRLHKENVLSSGLY
jgi:hypothetical protein